MPDQRDQYSACDLELWSASSEREDPTDDGEASEHKNDRETNMRHARIAPFPNPSHSFDGYPRW